MCDQATKPLPIDEAKKMKNPGEHKYVRGFPPSTPGRIVCGAKQLGPLALLVSVGAVTFARSYESQTQGEHSRQPDTGDGLHPLRGLRRCVPSFKRNLDTTDCLLHCKIEARRELYGLSGVTGTSLACTDILWERCRKQTNINRNHDLWWLLLKELTKTIVAHLRIRRSDLHGVVSLPDKPRKEKIKDPKKRYLKIQKTKHDRLKTKVHTRGEASQTQRWLLRDGGMK